MKQKLIYIILWGIKVYVKQSKTMQKSFAMMPNLQTHYNFKIDLQKVDLHAGCMWLIHGTQHRKNNQLQNLELPCRIS